MTILSNDSELRALGESIRRLGWTTELQSFIESNCDFFVQPSPTRGQQDWLPGLIPLWHGFQELSEVLLANLLAEKGCTIDQLEVALGQLSHLTCHGPRDAIAAEAAASLSTVSDFRAFAEMMRSAAESSGITKNDVPIRAVLLQMGYSVEVIRRATREIQDEYRNHDEQMNAAVALCEVFQREIDHKREIEDETKRSAAIATLRSRRESQNAHYIPKYDSRQGFEHTRPSGNPPSHIPKNTIEDHYVLTVGDDELTAAVKEFLKELKEARLVPLSTSTKYFGETLQSDFLMSLFTSADQIISTFDESVSVAMAPLPGQRYGDSTGKTQRALYDWANELCQFRHDLLLAYLEKSPAASIKISHPHGLLVWFQELENTRVLLQNNDVDLCDPEAYRLANLDAIAAGGTEDERRLHQLLRAHDAIRQQLAICYGRCDVFILLYRIPSEIATQAYNDITTQLQGAIHGASSDTPHVVARAIEEVELEPTTAISTLLQSDVGGELLDVILDLPALEHESLRLRRLIYLLLGLDGSAAAAAEEADSLHSPFSSAVQDDHRVPSLYRYSDALSLDMVASSCPSEEKAGLTPVKPADSKNSSNPLSVVISETQDDQLTITGSSPIDAKMDPTSSFNSRRIFEKKGEPEDWSTLLSQLHAQHRSSLKNLSSILSAQKEARLSNLRNRLTRQRRVVDSLQSALACVESTSEAESISAELAEATELLAALRFELSEDETKADNLYGQVHSGVRQRYAAEVAVLTNYAESNVIPPESTETFLRRPKVNSEVNSYSSEAILAEHHRRCGQLVIALEDQRRRQLSRLHDRLAARQNKTSQDDDSSIKPEEVNIELTRIDADMERQLDAVFEQSREELLTQLAATMCSSFITDNDTSNEYMMDTVPDNNQTTVSWLTALDAIRNRYANAADNLEVAVRTKREMAAHRLRQRLSSKTTPGKDTLDALKQLTDSNSSGAKGSEEEQEMIASILTDRRMADTVVGEALIAHIEEIFLPIANASITTGNTNHVVSAAAAAVLKETMRNIGNSKSADDFSERVRNGIIESYEASIKRESASLSLRKKQAADSLSSRLAKRVVANAAKPCNTEVEDNIFSEAIYRVDDQNNDADTKTISHPQHTKSLSTSERTTISVNSLPWATPIEVSPGLDRATVTRLRESHTVNRFLLDTALDARAAESKVRLRERMNQRRRKRNTEQNHDSS